MYSDVVLGIEINHFEKHLERAKEKRGVKQDGAFRVFLGLEGYLKCCTPPCISHCKISVEDCELLADDLEKLVKSHLISGC